MGIITEEAVRYKDYIEKTWPKLVVKLEIPLSKLFPKPENKGLLHIWRYGAADVVVYRNGKLVCIVEPGGAHHMTDEKQKKNDRRKWKLCDINHVKCLRVMNGTLDALSNRKKRQMVGNHIFGG
jgi:hypothetical protein